MDRTLCAGWKTRDGARVPPFHHGRHWRSAAALQNSVSSWLQLGYLDLPLREPYNSRVLGASEASAVETRGLIHMQSIHLIRDKRPTMMGEGYFL